MRQVNLYEAKTSLSALVEEAAAGVDIVIAKNGRPRARLVAIDPPAKPKRVFGVYDHLGLKVPDDFDDPMPDLEALVYDEPEPSL